MCAPYIDHLILWHEDIVCPCRLRVKDKEGLEGNTTTLLAVIKETDYPPTANAGGDQIIYLPQVSPDALFISSIIWSPGLS